MVTFGFEHLEIPSLFNTIFCDPSKTLEIKFASQDLVDLALFNPANLTLLFVDNNIEDVRSAVVVRLEDVFPNLRHLAIRNCRTGYDFASSNFISDIFKVASTSMETLSLMFRGEGA